MSKKFFKLVSPVGTARYAYLDKPSDKFAPTYKVDLIVPADKCVELCQQLDEKNKEAFEEECKAHPKDRKFIQPHEPYILETDESGEETGNVIFKFKGSTTYMNKAGLTIEKKIKAFDSKAKAIEMPAVYTGSTLRVEFTPISYYNPANKSSGVSLRILSVQILDLVTFDTDGKARGYGEETEYSYLGDAVPLKPVAPVLADPTITTADRERVNNASRELLMETIAAISREEGLEETVLLQQLTMDRNGHGGVSDINDVLAYSTRLDGTPFSPLQVALEKAKKRLAVSEKIPFTAAG